LKNYKKLYSENLYGLYSALNVIRVTVSRVMRWVAHVADKKNKKLAKHTM